MNVRDWQNNVDFRVVSLEGASDAILLTADNSVFFTSKETADRLRRGIDALMPAELAQLEALGASQSEQPNRRAIDSKRLLGAQEAVNVNLTAVCNLACTYCFAEGGDYGRIKDRLGLPEADAILDHLARRTDAGQRARFEFFGGEPLLNLDTMEYLCERSLGVAEEKGIEFVYRVSTNLTHLPQRALDLFDRHNFIVSVSIDGGQETHDRHRPSKGGKGSWQRIIDNCRKVRALGDRVTMVARMTCMGGQPSLLEDVRQLHELNVFDWFQIFPGVMPGDAGNGQLRVATDFLRQFNELIGEYDSLFTSESRFRGVLEYERTAQMISEGLAAVSYCSAGRRYSTVSPDKSIMPCHRLVGSTSFQIGDTRDGITANLSDWQANVDERPICDRCSIRYICGGGCKQENWLANNDVNMPPALLCDYQFSLVDGVIATLQKVPAEARRSNWRQLDDLFVSCGRPVAPNERVESGGSSLFEAWQT